MCHCPSIRQVGEGFVSVVGHARDLIIEGLAARFPAFDGDTVSPSTLLQRGPPTMNPWQ